MDRLEKLRRQIEHDMKIREAYEAGASLRELADLYGLNPSTIKRTVERAGGTTRSSGGARPRPARGLLGWVRE